MTKTDDGGAAFPTRIPTGTFDEVFSLDSRSIDLVPNYVGGLGMSLRDWFAGHAGKDDINQYIPETYERVAELMERLGILKPESEKYRDAYCQYTKIQFGILCVWARYKYADAMLAERLKERDDASS